MSDLDDIKNKISQLAEQFEVVMNKVFGFSKATKDATAVEKTFDKTIDDLRNGFGSYSKALGNATQQVLALREAIKKGGTNFSQYNKTIKEQIEQLKILKKEEKEVAAIKEMINKEVEKQTRTTEDHIKAVIAQKRAITNVMSVALSYGKVFGAQAITLQGMKDKVTKYNLSLFNLKRTQTLLGAGTKDLDKAFKSARETTYMNQVETAEYINTVNKLHMGMKPAAGDIVQFAAAIQREFGPSMETTLAVTQDLYNVQAKLPSLFNNIKTAITGAGKGLTESSKELAASNLMRLIAMGADQKTIEEVVRLQEAQATGQDDLAALNKETAKAAQSSADAELKAGKAVEGTMTQAARATRKFYDGLQQIPNAVAGIAATMGLIDIASSLNVASIFKLIAAQKELNAIRAAGNNIPVMPNVGGAGALMQTSGAGQRLASGAMPGIGPGLGSGTKYALKPRGTLFPTAPVASPIAPMTAPMSAPVSAGGGAGMYSRISGSLGTAGGAIKGLVGGAVQVKLMTDALGAIEAISSEEVRIAQEQKMQDASIGKNMLTGFLESGKTITTAVYAAGGWAKEALIDRRQQEKSGREQDAQLNKQIRTKYGEEKYSAAKTAVEGDISSGKTTLKENQTLDQLINRRLMFESDEHKQIAKTRVLQAEINAKVKEQRENVANAAIEYGRIKAEAEGLLQINQAIVDSYGRQLDVEKEFGVVNKATLEGRMKAAKQAAEDYRVQEDGIAKIIAITRGGLKEGIKAQVSFEYDKNAPEKLLQEMQKAFNLSQEDEREKVADELAKKEQKINEIRAQGLAPQQEGQEIAKEREASDLRLAEIQKGSRNAQSSIKEISDIITKKKNVEGQASRTILENAYGQVKVQDEYNQMIGRTLTLQRQVMESGQFGLGASITMMQKQVDLAYARLDALKGADAEARKLGASELKISTEYFDQLDAATSKSEQDKIIAKAEADSVKQGVLAGEATKTLGGYIKEHNANLQTQLQTQVEINELTKEVREGYLSAIKQMAVGSSAFSKIIGTQTRGVSQLMDITKKITGAYETNTMAMGGQVTRGTDLGEKPVLAASVTGGLQAQYSKEEQEKIAEARNYWKSKAEQPRKIGTAQAPEGQAALSALKAAGTQTDGGGTVTTPSSSATTQDALAKVKGTTIPGVGNDSYPANRATDVAVPPSKGNQSTNIAPLPPSNGTRGKTLDDVWMQLDALNGKFNKPIETNARLYK